MFNSPSFRHIALQLYRAGVVLVLAVLVRNQHIRLQIDGGLPITLSEVLQFLKSAATLKPDLGSERTGLDVFNSKQERIGYALHTIPECRDIKGYAGPTDTLVVFDEKWIIRGVAIRRSADTITHVADVTNDAYFLKSWEGKSWDDLAVMDLKKAGVEGVSGASLTSMGLARSLLFRVRKANDALAPPPSMIVRWADICLFAALTFSLLIAFTKLRGIVWLRAVWQLILIGGVGILGGQLLALGLARGWTASGVGWRIAPGLALIAAASMLVPWVTKRALYCQYICPHGAAQEWLHRITPKFLRINLHPEVASGLRWTPGLLMVMALAVVLLGLPMDLADLEPFDAYMLRATAWASMVIAGIGLIASVFVPMAYCKFGCPTGAILEFIRARGPGDKFSRRDWMAAFLVLLSVWIYFDYGRINGWIGGM